MSNFFFFKSYFMFKILCLWSLTIELKQGTFLRSQRSVLKVAPGLDRLRRLWGEKWRSIKQWIVLGITRVTDILSVFTLAIWNVFAYDIAFRISERSLLLIMKGTHTFSLPHSHMDISSFTLCGSRKYPYPPPPMEDDWKFRGEGGSKPVISEG